MWEGLSSLITLAVLILKLYVDNKTAAKAKELDEDKKIDAANSLDDFIHLDDELCNK